jgi:WD40 repeat protein
VLYPNDQYLLVGCFDHSIYITKCNYDSNSFDIVATFNKHDNIINSIALDPFIEQTGRFVSLSDKGRLIITNFDTSSDKLNIVHNYEEFVNNSHKYLITQKQIDWSVDGKWIVSVDHHQIKRQNILHARLINVNDVPSSQILIGHESPVLTAKFSKCWYSENSANSSDEFQLCATSDRNGNLIIWKIVKESFNVLVEVNNYSESNITSMIWSHNGEYLITVNSSGSVCAIELNEFKIKVDRKYNYIDLLLFNYEYNCFVVIELKATELRKEHIGQIQVYMNYIDENLKKVTQDKTIGIIICRQNNKYIIKYCSDNRIISREYKLV